MRSQRNPLADDLTSMKITDTMSIKTLFKCLFEYFVKILGQGLMKCKKGLKRANDKDFETI